MILLELWETEQDPRTGVREVKWVTRTRVNIRKHDPRIGAKGVKWAHKNEANSRSHRIKGSTLETGY